MTQAEKEILDQLGKNNYYTFLKYAIGIKIFCRRDGSKFITDYIRDNVKKYFKKIGYLIEDSKKTLFYVNREDAERRIFRTTEREYSAYEYFDDIDEPILLAILIAVAGFEKITNEQERIISEFDTRTFFDRYKPKMYQFIVGAGLNLDKNLYTNIGSWDDLIESIRNEVRTIKNMEVPTQPPDLDIKYAYKLKIVDRLINFEESICNTNYIAPEILKKLDEDKYYSVIRKNLYSSFVVDKLNCKYNMELVDTSAYQILRILERQKQGRVLTFNYDNVMEMIFEKNFSGKWQSVYKGKDFDKNNEMLFIHPHGYFPFDEELGSHKSIILSTYEYFWGYYKRNAYARKKLCEQLADTNIIIGNSVSDYEEQKVFYSQFKGSTSSWHFLFAKASDVADKWMDTYKICYFMNMGIVPVFFNDYKDITDFLKTL